jgi:hypothetical protein
MLKGIRPAKLTIRTTPPENALAALRTGGGGLGLACPIRQFKAFPSILPPSLQTSRNTLRLAQAGLSSNGFDYKPVAL